MPPKPRPKLISLQTCEHWGGILADERRTRAALENMPTLSTQMQGTIGAQMFLAFTTQHSTIYAVDHDLRFAAMSADGSPESLELPPLPFKNIVIECDTDHVWSMSENDHRLNDHAIECFAIQEVEVGTKWTAQFVIRDEEEIIPETLVCPEELRHRPWKLHPIVVTQQGMAHDAEFRSRRDNSIDHWPDQSPIRDLYWAFAVEAVHYITARGVNLALTTPSRAERREAKRGGYVVPERVYWLTISDEPVTGISGRSDREYHCRWMVRGHWRHFHNRKPTWIRPYIKGPAGAPWRGRPIYHVPAEAA